MSRIHRSSDGFQPDARSSWQRDRASAPMERNPEDGWIGLAGVLAIGLAIVAAVLAGLGWLS